MYEGFGYGYVNLFPGSDTSLAHIDIEESIFPFEHHTTHHLSGRSCKNMDKAEDIICKEDLQEKLRRIGSLLFLTNTMLNSIQIKSQDHLLLLTEYFDLVFNSINTITREKNNETYFLKQLQDVLLYL